MKSQKILRKSRAVSPVIATVVLVAVTITVAVAVSYWMSGIAGQYTAFEKLEIQTAISTYEPIGAPTHWMIVISLKNSGTKTATLTNVFVNDAIAGSAIGSPAGDPVTTITAKLDVDISEDPDAAIPLLITSGDIGTVTVYIGAGYGTLSPGTTVNIKIHSASGMDYIKLVQLT